jgi:8-oxo-dGTP pyrophosphatase MutT (NUDIX family)
MDKACPVVLRLRGGVEVLAFRHPEAGLQIVKGTIERGETPEQAAVRELAEEAGIDDARASGRFGSLEIGEDTWHFVRIQTGDLPERWVHPCKDDGGHDFAFFWHPLDAEADGQWHDSFRQALRHIAEAVG